jgi:hypothetical protein
VIITAYVIAALVGLGIIYIGLSYLFAPMTVAPAFGFRALPTGGDGYYNVKGVRDIVAGLIVGAFMLYGDHRALALVLAVEAVIPIGDMMACCATAGARAPPSASTAPRLW